MAVGGNGLVVNRRDAPASYKIGSLDAQGIAEAARAPRASPSAAPAGSILAVQENSGNSSVPLNGNRWLSRESATPRYLRSALWMCLG